MGMIPGILTIIPVTLQWSCYSSSQSIYLFHGNLKKTQELETWKI